LSFPKGALAPISGLSRAESAVLRLAASGLHNAEIASSRGVAIATVQNQLARAFKKLGVGSRSEAASWLAARDLAPF
jgi:DNA-binding CsgD family transcriptional regulator